MIRQIPRSLRDLPESERLAQLHTRLFLDIQTVPIVEDYTQLAAPLQALWERKCRTWAKEDFAIAYQQLWVDRAALFAEFSKIAAIGLGYFLGESDKEVKIRCTVLEHPDEKRLLEWLLQVFNNQRFSHPATALVAHNGKDFDFPFLCRRLLLNGLPIPFALEMKGKRPFELHLEDTMDMWRFGERRSFISLRGLGLLFGLKDGFSVPDFPSMQKTYFAKGSAKALIQTALEDVKLTMQCYLRLNGLPSLPDDAIQFVEFEETT